MFYLQQGLASLLHHLLLFAIGSPVGIASPSFNFIFWITTGIVRKYIKNYTKWKEEADKIVMLARNKFKSIENRICKAFIDNEIWSHEDFETIVNEEKAYWEWKGSFRIIKKSKTWY